MTEAQWLASADPVAMLLFATENPDHQDIACCRSERKLSLIKEAWESPLCGNERWCLGFVPGCDGRIADPLLAVQINIMTKYKPVAANILRDIVGNPFRPVALPPGCLTPLVAAIAQEAYKDRDAAGHLKPEHLLPLSDALEEAGCPSTVCDNDHSHRGTRLEHTVCVECNADIVDHPLLAALRSEGPHYRGFWALDIVLGKE